MSQIGKKLFAFDLDGTLLSNGELTIETKKIVAKLRKDGHIVCILTGRPWRATEKIYNELELDTIVANYNGGHLHNPKDYSFLPIIQRVHVSDVIRILSHKNIKKIARNIAVEGQNYLLLDNQESDFFNNFLLADDKTNVFSPIEWGKMSSDPTGVLIEIKAEYESKINSIKNYFESVYGDMVEFSYWDNGNDSSVFEFTNRKARKDIALIRIARYYHIEMEDVIAFGDSHNDIHMLKVSGIGVAMANANDVVKSYANIISKHTNSDDGITKFINWYFKTGHEKVKKTIYNFETRKESEHTTRIFVND